MRIAAFTMTHNESVNLPIWCAYYGRHLGVDNIFVIDHGSTDGSTFNVAGNLVRIPRDFNGADIRLPIVSKFQQFLLGSYDVVIYTDCDEIIIPDPALYQSLRDYCEKNGGKRIACNGADLLHVADKEKPLDLTKPILGQRKHWYWSKFMCKPLVSSSPTEWQPGFHVAKNNDIVQDEKLFLVHLRWMDENTSLDRMRYTRSMQWSPKAMELGWGAHARQDDEKVKKYFADMRGRFKARSESDPDLITSETVPYGPLITIPDKFMGLV